MKKKEKRMIIGLIIVAVVIIVAIVVFKNTKKGNSGTGIAQNNGTTVSDATGENQGENPAEKPEEKPVEEYVQNFDDGTKLNVSTKLNETKTVDGYEVTNIQLTNKDGITVILADVTNKTGKDQPEKPLVVKLFDKEGNELVKLDGMIEALKDGATAQLNMGVTADYANAYDFTIE